MNRAQRADEKNVVIYLFIMFTPRGMVIKIKKMVHILYFLLMKAKISNSLEIIFKATERSYLVLLENAMNYWVLSSY